MVEATMEPACSTGNRIVRALTSTGTALVLFGLLVMVSIPDTLMEAPVQILSTPRNILMIFLGVITLSCTIRRWKRLPPAVTVVHTGVILVIAGALLGTAGFVATANIYEGSTTDQFFHPDLDRDLPLGIDLTVEKIEDEIHPVPVQLGIMKEGKKYRLLTLKTGDSFQLDGERVRVDSLDVPAKKLLLSVIKKDGSTVGMKTSGLTGEQVEYPYEFRLVAYRDPVLKQTWSSIRLHRSGKPVAAGRTSVNYPLRWGDLLFYNTQIGYDSTGRKFAGIQIVRDPGRGVAFAGMAILALGAILCSARRMYGWR